MGWDKPPTIFVDDIEDNLAGLRTEIILFAHRGAVLRSPVDTGRYRGSHVISYGAPSNAAPPAGSLSAGIAAAKGASEIAAGARTPYAVVFMSTNLAYSERIENGWSKQAPVGVYAVTFNDLTVRYSA